MNMNRRIGKLEESLKTDAKYSKYKNCEIVIKVNFDSEDNSDNSNSYCVCFPDGHEEWISDPDIIKYIENIDDSITVTVVD